MPNKSPEKPLRPAQKQKKQPGIESAMVPKPESFDLDKGPKLKNKVAIITGGDSGIGKAVAILFASEGADIAIAYLDEHEDAKKTQQIIEALGQKCLTLSGDVKEASFCQTIVDKTLQAFGQINILVNNAAEQHPHENFEDIKLDEMEDTFRTNVFAHFYLIKYALPYLKKNDVIINTTSVTAYRGSEHLIDYAATKGAIVSFTRSLSQNLVSRGIRVNAVAPGPVWTPLIPATFKKEHVAKFGSKTPMKRAGEPKEIAPCYLFLASSDSSFMTGQVLHPNGGEVING